MLQNISMQMTNMNSMKMNNMNMNMGKTFQNMMPLNNFNINNPTTKIYNIILKDSTGKNDLFQFNEGLTIKEMIERYLEQKDIKPENDYVFLYNSHKINQNDMTTIGHFFVDNINPTVRIIKISPVIGG